MSAARVRAAAWLAGVWAGLIGAIGFVAAPTLFASLARADAGRVAGRLFAIDAVVGLAMGAALLLLTTQRRARQGGARATPHGSHLPPRNAERLLVVAALVCIAAGHYALVPLLDAAGRGRPGPSFAVLHGVGSMVFVVKFAVVAALAWRLGKVHADVGEASAARADVPMA